ncbi:SF0329 family protein [Priestia filamentosa]|uniref:SF0329 family protein n=1 Tax=Priestia filamentosa TaxID=1402861 RepID=UPI003B8A74FB
MDFFSALEEYFSLPVEKALCSSNAIVKMLCMMDRRVGKRTLLRSKESILEEHRIIKYFYQLRCEAEGIRSKSKVS